MSNSQQPAFFPMAFPIQGPSVREDQPPARVRLAVDFLALLIHKQMPRAAVNDMAIEWAEGQKLTGPEVESHIAACDLLTDYFRGRLRSDPWEKQLMNRERLRTELEKEQATAGHGKTCLAMRCLNCPTGHPRPDCVMCRGSGNVLVYPMNDEED